MSKEKTEKRHGESRDDTKFFPVLLSHRGGSLEFEENTMGAFAGSYEAGLRAFETDVRTTRDGELVLMHDDTVTRTTGAEGAVEEMTLAQVRELRTLKTNSQVPLLSEFLGYFAGKERSLLHLEMKAGRPEYTDEVLAEYCRKLYAAVKAARDVEVRFTSFNKRALVAMRSVAPESDLVYLCGPGSAEHIRAALELGARYISCRLRDTPPEVFEEARRAGLHAAGYGAHELEIYKRAIEVGAEFVTTDRPKEMNAWRLARMAEAEQE